MNAQPVTLEGHHVRLELLSHSHVEQLCEVGLDGELWKWSTTAMKNSGDMKNYIDTALQWQSEGTALPFAIIDKQSGYVIYFNGSHQVDDSPLNLKIIKESVQELLSKYLQQ